MKILVLSDSHSSLRLMRSAVQAVKPNAIIHLGDYFDDGEVIREENMQIAYHSVPGNCDKYRMYQPRAEVLAYPVCGVRLYMTHGHNHHVKQGLYNLLEDAKASDAQAELFGHTHIPLCEQKDGLWILNPGSCGHSGGTVGLMEVENGEIMKCRILRQEDLEEVI